MALFVVIKECGETKNSFQIVDDTPVVDVLPLHERIIVGDYTLIARTAILPKRFGFDDDRPHLLRCFLPYQGKCTPITISLKAPRFRPDISQGRQELAFA
jgi:hypothetical protein